MICSSVNRFFFILSVLNGPDSNRFWGNFSGAGQRIERKCITYVRMNESVLGPFETQGDADKLFLMLIRSELDHPVDEDRAQHSLKAWISASTSEANKRRH